MRSIFQAVLLAALALPAAAVATERVRFTQNEMLLLRAMQADPAVRAEYDQDLGAVRQAAAGHAEAEAYMRFVNKWLPRIHQFSASYAQGSAAALPKPSVEDARVRVPWVASIGPADWNGQVFTQLLNTLDGAEAAFVLSWLESMNETPDNEFRASVTQQLTAAAGVAPPLVAGVLVGHVRQNMAAVQQAVNGEAAGRAQTAREQLDLVARCPNLGFEGAVNGCRSDGVVAAPPPGTVGPPVQPGPPPGPEPVIAPPAPGSMPVRAGNGWMLGLARNAHLVGAGAGALLGFLFGGPMGALIGLAVGGIGGFLLKKRFGL